MKNNQIVIIRIIVVFLINSIISSCVYDKTTDISVINRSKNNNFVLCYADTIEKNSRPSEIYELYNIWKIDSGIHKNYLFNPKYEGVYFPILKNGERVEHIGGFGRNVFCFCIINIDILYNNYQKGLPVDSFDSYEIKKYTREELKKTNYQIVIED